MQLPKDYSKKIVSRWSKQLDKGAEIKDDYVKTLTAIMMENTYSSMKESGMVLTEAAPTGAMSAQGAPATTAPASSNTLGAFNWDSTVQNSGVQGPYDSRIATMLMPTVRRVFPELLAHDLVGVQPMHAPVSIAVALRFFVDKSGVGTKQEIGWNIMDDRKTGTDQMSSDNTRGSWYGISDTAEARAGLGTVHGSQAQTDMWSAYTGTAETGSNYDGQGVDLAGSEWWAIGTDMPMASLKIEKAIVEARERKIAANWSLELAEDLQKMMSMDVDSEMINAMSYEIKAETDRQLVSEMVKSAIVATRTSTWDPIKADGNKQSERIGTLATQIAIKSQEIARYTRRGAANFLITTPTIVGLMERVTELGGFDKGFAVNGEQVGIALVGTTRSGAVKVYRDSFAKAASAYVLLGYKGPGYADSGIIFCPYIPLQIARAVGMNSFDPRVGLRTRYGIANNLFGAGNYYHFIKVSGLTDTYTITSNRQFTF